MSRRELQKWLSSCVILISFYSMSSNFQAGDALQAECRLHTNRQGPLAVCQVLPPSLVAVSTSHSLQPVLRAEQIELDNHAVAFVKVVGARLKTG